MEREHPTRRRYLRWSAALAAGGTVALAGCSRPEDDGNDTGDGGGGVY